MVAIDLSGEHLASLDGMVREHGLSKLVALGVSGPGYVKAGLVGLEHVELFNDLFQPMPGGVAAYIAPVLDRGELVDLVTWPLDRPVRWALRLGVAFALGADAIAEARLFPRSAGPLPLFRTPLSWLLAGCEGACILRPEDAWRELADIAEVVAQDIGHGRAIEKMLSPPRRPRPKVLVKQAEGIAA